MQWRQADKIEVRFRGHKGDQNQKGNVRARTRDEAYGPRSGCRAAGGAVDLMVALLSCHSTLPDSAPLASYRCGREVKVMKYNQALQALREIVERTGRNPKEFALYSLRIWWSFYPRSWGIRIRKGDSERGTMEVRCVQDVHREQ